jgi:4-hydroxy-3-methylbut-2-enyl diphosphate reductase
MNVLLANPRGFCAGVERAIAIVERAIEKHGAPVYVRHEVVHNKFVVDDLKEKGAIFVEELDEITQGQVVIFSAHGVAQSVRKQAQAINSIVYDATCPLVTKVHKEVIKQQKSGAQMLLIGHKGHPEVEGTLGQSVAGDITLIENLTDVAALDLSAKNLSYTTQTTLSVDDTRQIVNALKTKFPHIQAPKKDDICYATQNRQDAVKTLIELCDVLLVIGSANSSNSNRLREIADKNGIPAYLIDGADEVKSTWFKHAKSIGVTAGASAPEVLVKATIQHLKTLGAIEINEINGTPENVHFPVPKTLKNQFSKE